MSSGSRRKLGIGSSSTLAWAAPRAMFDIRSNKVPLAAAELTRRRGPEGIDWHEPPPPALGRRVLRLAIGDPAPAAERIDALLGAAEGARGGIAIDLGRGRTAHVRGRRIVIGL